MFEIWTNKLNHFQPQAHDNCGFRGEVRSNNNKEKFFFSFNKKKESSAATASNSRFGKYLIRNKENPEKKYAKFCGIF